MLYLKNRLKTLKKGIKPLHSVMSGVSCMLFFAVLFSFCSGCATVQRKKIEFINPYTILPVTRVAPDDSESKGVLLRLKAQPLPVVYKDIVQIYTQIEGDSAIPVDITKFRELSFKEGSSPKSFILSTKTTTNESESRSGTEEIELDSRGAIVNFIKGEFTTKYGEMTVLSHKRSALFPAKPVSVGDKWDYTEEVEMKFDSTLVSRENDMPDKIKVECQLQGFALFDGLRCAVISTKTITRRVEHYSTFWKDVDFDVNLYTNEIIYFDYKRGLILGSTTKTDSYSNSKKLDFSDVSRSQSITILEKNRK